MGIEALLSDYVLGDGQIVSLKLNLNYQESSNSEATIELIVRKPAGKKKLEK